MTTRLMKASAVADTFSVERTRKPTKPIAKPAAPRKRAPAKPAAPRKRAPAAKSTVSKPIEPTVSATPPAEPTSPTADRGRRRRRFAFASAALVMLAAASISAGVLFLQGDDRSDQSGAAAPAVVSAERLASFASSHDGPVYWVGAIRARRLELTTTSAGTFVRYLPVSASVGGSGRAITVATYPLRDAFATAVERSKSPQMTSRETAGGALVVWSLTRPTSVYVAFPGVPHLVEVYAPDAEQARTLALSGRIRPVQ